MPGAKRSLLQLANDVNGLGLIIQTRALNMTKYVIMKTLTYLVNVTPVDTSKAESNWIVSIGGSGYGLEPRPPFFAGTAGSTQEASAQAAIEAGRQALKSAIAGKPVAIVNPLPYIGRLNEGSSAQAPAGFVDRGLVVAKQAVKEYNFNQRLKEDIRRGRVTDDG